MQGQLQEAGNTTTLSHYLELLSGAGLLTGLSKFSMQAVRQRSSSPRLMVYNTALLSAQAKYDFNQAVSDKAHWGHLIESCVGAHLLNSTRNAEIQLLYWRENNVEVDFVLQQGDETIAIAVKSGILKNTPSGLGTFRKKFNPKKTLLVGNQGIPLEEFISLPAAHWFA